MTEKEGAFSKGVKVEITCIFGYRADITLKRPNSMDNREYKSYIKECRNACGKCKFEREEFCSKIGHNGSASADMFSSADKIDKALKRTEAPCVQGEVEVV